MAQRKTVVRGHAAVGVGRRGVTVNRSFVAKQSPLLSAAEQENEKLAFRSFICGWLGLLLAIPAILAIYFGICSRDANPRASSHRIIGMALGYLTVAIWLLIGCYFVVLRPIIKAETAKKQPADSMKTSAPAKK